MATTDLKKFLEDRLLALDPSMDLDSGSPAQTRFISPVLERLGSDPIETDIDKFMTDRFRQEFPDIYADDPSVVGDMFAKPLRVLLEPFKREIQSVKLNQSVKDPSLLSDDEADALLANFFTRRDNGGYSVGVARTYFPSPTNVQVESATKFFTPDGLAFFPTNSMAITAEEMAFNRQGALYYFDIVVKAEKPGSEYDIEAGDLTAVDGLYGAVKVSNPRRFRGGSPRQDTPTFVATAETALAERSLNVPRGASARIGSVFKGEVGAIQVIGAKDPEMQRDILVATSPGHAWITGTVHLYDKIAFVRARTVDGQEGDVPANGDTLYIYLGRAQYPGVPQSSRLVRLTVEETLIGPVTPDITPYQCSYLVRWSGTLPSGVSVVRGQLFDGGFTKKGRVRISSLPDVGEVSIAVDNGAVHVYGHTDLYVRPTTRDTAKAVLNGLHDIGKLGSTKQSPHTYLERFSLATGADSNAVTDTGDGFDFTQAGAEPGDTLIIETGPDAGSYGIGKVDGSTLHLMQVLTSDFPNARYKVLKKIRIDPFEPRIPKFPFGDLLNNDLSTTIGSPMAVLQHNDVLSFGAKAGDTFRVLNGPDRGSYTIKGFDPVFGGKGIILDRPFSSTSSQLQYEVFTPLEALEKPLVRVKEVLLLDSSKQSTGITVPPAEPVAIVPTSPFTAAQTLAQSQKRSSFILPDLADLLLGVVERAAVTADGNDRRYSMGFDIPNGVYRAMLFDDGTQAELDLRSDTSGKCSYFMVTCEDIENQVNYPPANPNPGDTITIKNGPNRGSYIVKNVIKFKHRDAQSRTYWTYFIKIYGQFKVDVFKQVINFLRDANVPTGLEPSSLPDTIPFPSFFSDWYASLGEKMNAALGAIQVPSPPTAAQIQQVLEELLSCEYEWGTPSRGVFRTYFQEPTLFEQRTGDADPSVTVFTYKTKTGDTVRFRPDPLRYRRQEIVPARVDEDADPTTYPRNLDASVSGTATILNAESKLGLFELGVRDGDVLSVHEENFPYPTFAIPKRHIVGIQTVAGSAQVVLPPNAGFAFLPSMTGNLLFIEDGADKGGYKIVKVLDGRNAVLDKPLTKNTSASLKSGYGANFGVDGSARAVVKTALGTFSGGDVGKYITIFGHDYGYMGSFVVQALVDATGGTMQVTLPSGTTWPALSTDGAVRWIITAAPVSAPKVIIRDPAIVDAASTELVAIRPCRIYDANPHDYIVTQVPTTEQESPFVLIEAGLTNGIGQPYRVYRNDVRRVTPTEMDAHWDGSLCYFDTEVISLSGGAASNIQKESYLELEADTYRTFGYKHAVADSALTYSMLETGFLDLPTEILPIGSADGPGNRLSLIGAPVRVSYERADLVRQVQEFVGSPRDRVTSANMLVRHFLPAYVSYAASYTGGSAPSVIAKNIISYINSLPVENPIDVSELQKKITESGGNPQTPTRVQAVIHDWGRKMWAEFSENEMGGSTSDDTLVPYHGTPRVMYFVPGPDTSGQTDVSGEQITLYRR